MFRITIPKPCNENWNEMTPTQQGAFCAVCSKEVVDFTGMSDGEVKDYFLLNAGKKTCGRFKQTQLSGLHIMIDEQVIYTDISLWKKFLAAVIICFGTFMSSCTNKAATTGQMMSAKITAPVDTTKKPVREKVLVGDTVAPASCKKPYPPMPGDKHVTIVSTYVTGDIEPEPIILNGEPVAEEVIPVEEKKNVMPAGMKKVSDTCNMKAIL